MCEGQHSFMPKRSDNYFKTGVRNMISLLNCCEMESETRPLMSNFLWPHGLYSPWNSPGQNTGVAFPFSRGSSQPRDRTQVSHIASRFFFFCRQILYQLSHIFAKLYVSNFQNWLWIWLEMQQIYKYFWKTWHISSTEIVHPKTAYFLIYSNLNSSNKVF